MKLKAGLFPCSVFDGLFSFSTLIFHLGGSFIIIIIIVIFICISSKGVQDVVFLNDCVTLKLAVGGGLE